MICPWSIYREASLGSKPPGSVLPGAKANIELSGGRAGPLSRYLNLLFLLCLRSLETQEEGMLGEGIRDQAVYNGVTEPFKVLMMRVLISLR